MKKENKENKEPKNEKYTREGFLEALKKNIEKREDKNIVRICRK